MPFPQAHRTGTRHLRALALALSCIVGLVAALACAPGASAATSCPDADARPGTVGTGRSAAAMRCLVDHERQAAGLQPLAVDTRVTQAAQDHADDMAARNYFAHDAPAPAPAGTTVGDRLGTVGYPWAQTGENLGRGQPTPRAVMAAWLASPGHCANLMAAQVTTLGIGISPAGGGPYWVQVLARPTGVAVPSGPSGTCPRVPALPMPDGTPAPVAGVGATTGGGQSGTSSGSGTSPGSTDEPATASAVGATGAPSSTVVAEPVRATATRRHRRLVIHVRVPADAGRASVVLRVRQRGRTVRVVGVRLTGGHSHRLAVSLPTARAGRVVVVTPGSSAAARFR